MQNLQQRLDKFTKEREEIRAKMEILKKDLKPLSKRLRRVSTNIAYIKFKMKQ